MSFKLSPKEFSDRITEALESGRFMQATGSLTHSFPSGRRGYCCLGVACEVYIENGGGEALRRDDMTYKSDEEYEDNYLPRIVMDALGATAPNPELRAADIAELKRIGVPELKHLSLAGINDNGATFKQIAEVFRQRLFHNTDGLEGA